jgi:hypothetical protein
MSINPRFVNETGTDLTAGKIHTIRQNYAFWKKFEGRDIELFTWEGKPYQKGSKQKTVCVKHLIYVQRVLKETDFIQPGCDFEFFLMPNLEYCKQLITKELAKNDGFDNADEFNGWFADYPDGEMSIVHFTLYRY